MSVPETPSLLERMLTQIIPGRAARGEQQEAEGQQWVTVFTTDLRRHPYEETR